MWRRAVRATVGEPLRGPIKDATFPGLMVTTGAPFVVEGPSVGRIELHEHDRRVRAGASEGTLQPPKGWGRRSAANAAATLDGHELELDHRRRRAARLLLDGREIATLTTDERPRPPRPNDRASYLVAWASGVEPRVAGLGHALASRYGVGAPGAGRRALGLLGDLFAGGF